MCTCEDAGEMVCYDTVCPQLSCGADKLLWYRDDVCCPECISDWVQVSRNLAFLKVDRLTNHFMCFKTDIA